MQSNAIDMARDLKQKTDLILEDYKKAKHELDKMMDHSENVQAEANEMRNELERCQEEMRITKQGAIERQMSDEHLIQNLSNQVRENQRSNEELRNSIHHKTEEASRNLSDMNHYETQCRR
jgi:hypothetical protein